MLYAKKCGIVVENPCRDITFTKSPQKEKEVYSLEEAKKLLALIDEKAPLKYKLFFNLLAYSGMRRGEALGLEYKDVNFETSVLTVHRTSSRLWRLYGYSKNRQKQPYIIHSNKNFRLD